MSSSIDRSVSFQLFWAQNTPKEIARDTEVHVALECSKLDHFFRAGFQKPSLRANWVGRKTKIRKGPRLKTTLKAGPKLKKRRNHPCNTYVQTWIVSASWDFLRCSSCLRPPSLRWCQPAPLGTPLFVRCQCVVYVWV